MQQQPQVTLQDRRELANELIALASAIRNPNNRIHHVYAQFQALKPQHLEAELVSKAEARHAKKAALLLQQAKARAAILARFLVKDPDFELIVPTRGTFTNLKPYIEPAGKRVHIAFGPHNESEIFEFHYSIDSSHAFLRNKKGVVCQSSLNLATLKNEPVSLAQQCGRCFAQHWPELTQGTQKRIMTLLAQQAISTPHPRYLSPLKEQKRKLSFLNEAEESPNKKRRLVFEILSTSDSNPVRPVVEVDDFMVIDSSLIH